MKYKHAEKVHDLKISFFKMKKNPEKLILKNEVFLFIHA